MLLKQQGWIESATASALHTHKDFNPCPVSANSALLWWVLGAGSTDILWSLVCFFVFRMEKENPDGLGEEGGWKGPYLKQALLS